MSLSPNHDQNAQPAAAGDVAVPGAVAAPRLTYKQAAAELKKTGTSRAEGDALCAMYAQLLAGRMRGADPARFYASLAHNDDLIARYRKLCENAWDYTDALLTPPG